MRVAVVGCGGIAQAEHLPAFRSAEALGLARLVGVCDADRERATAVGARHSVPGFASFGELFAATRPEAVSIATQPAFHQALVVEALEAGCHVLCEKPVAMDLAGARAMVDTADRVGRLLSICFEYRYWDEARYLRDRIRAGDLGRVHHIRTWGGAVGAFPTSPGFHRRATAGAGVLTHWTIHNLDLALWLLDEPTPLTASAVGAQRVRGVPDLDAEIEDFAVGLVRVAGPSGRGEGGAAISVEANWLQPPSTRPEGWEVLGERGAASISPIRVWLERDGAWIDDTPAPGTLAPCDYDMTRLIHGFLEAVRDGGPAPVRRDSVLRVQAMMDALYESMAAGREVPVERID